MEGLRQPISRTMRPRPVQGLGMYRFKCDPTDKSEADKVLEENFSKKVPQMLFEEKKRATNMSYKNGNVPAEDVDEDGRMPHGRLAIANEAISNKDKAAIKSRKRTVPSPPSRVSAREIYQQKKISRLKKDLVAYRGLECVVRAMATKSRLDYDTLMKQYSPELSAFDQEGGNEIGEDEGNDDDTHGDYGMSVNNHEDNDDTDGDYGMFESDHEDNNLWIV
ncbi:hypothetical protein E2562_025869 [Oryza meyeriana var. granulata]|uniref:Uncharacterized protein n=1 Tax=Oryza meyeriana var. granulata TaxID=110450 RepID=A0A6G1D7W1_9ORYZ|nr:hypothetical protein E2562_025869 [Oryza meyeriana var. granulata]